MTNLSFQRELAAKALGVGKGRIRFDPERLEDVEDAITREEIRKLYRQGAIRVERVVGTSSGRLKARREKAKKRGRSQGNRKGPRRSGKDEWMSQVRALRRTLRDMRKRGDVDPTLYRKMYLRVKGGAVRTRRRLLELVEAEKHAKG